MDSAKVDGPRGDPNYVQPAHEDIPENATDMSTNTSLDKEANGDAHNVQENGALDEKHAAAPSAEEPHKGGAPPQDTVEKRSRGRVAIIMFALGMAVFLAALDITIITTALPTISDHFHSASGYTWIGAAYQLAAAAATPLWGKVSDIWGRKPTLLVANFIFFVGSLIAALSINVGMLIAARAIQGWGGGGLLVLVNITIGDLFSMRSRGAYYGIIGMVWAIASALGPIIGGAFTDKVSWRWCFYINLPLDGVAFAIILFFLDLETPRTPVMQGIKFIDWIGALSIVGGVVMLLLGLEFGGVSFPWESATVICLIVFGVVLIAAFFFHEWKFAHYPIMPLRLFKYRSNCAALLTCFLHGFVFIGISYFLPLYFQTVKGESPLMSGVLLLPVCLSLSFASALTGVFIRKTGKYQLPIWFGMVLLTIGTGLFIDFDADSSYGKLIGYQILLGVGVGPNFQAPLIALQSLIQPRDIASATSAFQFTRNMGVAISIVIGSVAFQNQMLDRSPELVRALGPGIAGAVGGNQAGANAPLIQTLPPAQRRVVHVAIADSLQVDWIMYTAFAGAGLLTSLLITKNKLTREHQITKTGVEAEQERRDFADEERRVKRASKAGLAPKVAGDEV